MEIPQAEKTFSVLLSKPFWIWGGEMGVNEHGVSIGNEAIFTSSVPYKKSPERSLLGMDILRLALERSSSAREAVQTIGHLIENYDQGGSCSFYEKFFYHNSFLVLDATVRG
jgi:secernin